MRNGISPAHTDKPMSSGSSSGPPTRTLAETLVTAVTLDEVSAKVRVGGPEDEPEDMGLRVWAGEIPLRTVADPAVADDHVLDGVDPPASVTDYSRPFGAGYSF